MQPAAVPPELVVRSDNAKLRARFRAILIMHVLLLVIMLASLGLLGAAGLLGEDGLRYAVWVFVILIAGQVFQIGMHCFHWGSRLAISQPLTLDGWGLEFQGQQGTVRVPWEAVTEIRQRAVLGNRILAFMLHPEAVPGQNGVEGDSTYWRRYQKSGLQLGAIGLVPGFETILPAVQHYSQGRTRIA